MRAAPVPWHAIPKRRHVETARRAAWPALVAVLALLAGCSSTKFVYDRLDWFVGWRLDDYLTLRADQHEPYNQGFEALWRWHRQEELPRYARELRSLAAALDGDVDAAAWQAFLAKTESAWKRLAMEAIRAACPLAGTLDEAQKADILQGLQKGIDKSADELQDRDMAERREHSVERLMDQLKRWMGQVTPEQRELVNQVVARSRPTADAWLEYRRTWRAAFAEALQQPQNGDCSAYEALFLESETLRSPALRADLEYNRAMSAQFLAEVVTSMTASQRRHTQKALRKLARDLEELANKQP